MQDIFLLHYKMYICLSMFLNLIPRPLSTSMLHNNKLVVMHANLRKRKHGGNIDDEIALQVLHSDLSRIPNELTASKNSRAPRDEGRSEFHENVQEVEEIGHRAEERDRRGESDVDGETRGAADVRSVEIERIEEEGEDGGDEEDVVPVGDDAAVRVQDLMPPWKDLAAVVYGDRSSVRCGGGYGLGEEEAERSDLIHLPWRIPVLIGFRS